MSINALWIPDNQAFLPGVTLDANHPSPIILLQLHYFYLIDDTCSHES